MTSVVIARAVPARDPAIELPNAERVSDHVVRLYFVAGTCSTPERAQQFPSSVDGQIRDGRLTLVVDSRLVCSGDSSSVGFDKQVLVNIEPTATWDSVLAVRKALQ